jgi:hypothetical protein
MENTKRVTWTARCKSGYTFKGKACNRVAPRGMLLCAECLTAEPIAVAVPKVGPWRMLLAAALSLIGA